MTAIRCCCRSWAAREGRQIIGGPGGLFDIVEPGHAKLLGNADGELQLTDAIATLLGEEAVLAYPFKGVRYDCGSKLGYLQATVELARKHPEVGAAFSAWMDGLSDNADAV